MYRFENEITFVIPDTCAKPRMTKADTWKKRPAVMKYRAFCDLVRKTMAETTDQELPEGQPVELEARVTRKVPKSWSAKKRAKYLGTPHLSRPDTSNFTKAIEDAIYPNEDSFIFSNKVWKVWGDSDRVEVTIRWGLVE